MEARPAARLYSAAATRGFTMRHFISASSMLALAAIAVPIAATGPAQAVEYPYCASGQWAGGGGCSYATLEQCRASISGVGGSCVSNPRYTAGATARPPRARR
jgi:hypothetical protein